MPRRGRSIRVAPGIYTDAIGIRAIVAVGHGPTRRQKETRWKADANRADIKAWQARTRQDLKRSQKVRAKASHGTLAADMVTYLKTVRHMPSLPARRADLDAWTPAFGTRPRSTISKLEVAAQLATWLEAGVAASTVNHRKTALHQLYVAFEDDMNPVAGLKRYREPDLGPRDLRYAVVEEILTAMPPSATRARLRVMAYTGIPPARLRRLRPQDLDLERGTVYLEARRKGRGTPGKTFPLTRMGVAAFTEFVAAQAFGNFSRPGLYIPFQRGYLAVNRQRAKAGRPLIPPTTAYALRHSFGSWVYMRTKDIRVTAELLDCTIQTALRYTKGTASPAMQAAISQLEDPVPVPTGRHAQND